MTDLQAAAPAQTFYIQDIAIHGDAVLAPMDGYTDSPFRRLARRMGSAISYTEFINARDVLYGHPHLQQRISFHESERPLAFQIFDNDPAALLEAAIRLRRLNPDLIDINLGCSARSVVGRGAGAGLLKDPIKVAAIFSSLSRALDIPVTAKIRLGWDENNRNYLTIARAIQENGGRMIAVHGRTRAQKFVDRADWDAIAEVKQTVSIPVIGNGGVHTASDIERMLQHTRCDAVMIGRAAIGHPWIFQRLERSQITPQMLLDTIKQHLHTMMDHYGQDAGLIRFRKHCNLYLKDKLTRPELKHRLLTIEDPQQFTLTLSELLIHDTSG